jgi:hypothetical protein
MSCSYYRWDKCHVLTIGGTKVGVAQKSGWHKCHVALMSVGQMSVGQMSVAQNSRHRSDSQPFGTCVVPTNFFLPKLYPPIKIVPLYMKLQ